MCACQEPGADRALLDRGSRARGTATPVPVPVPLFSPGQRTQALRRVCTPNPCLLSATWLPGAARSPPAGHGAWAAAGSQTDTSSPAAPLGASRVAAPPLAGRGAPRVAAPATRASIPPERAPAGCDWLIQTHLQRNASLRVPVGVQFKSAAPGAWGQAGAGSEDDSCAGAFPKAAVGFLKRVFRTGENACQEYPLWVQRSSPQSLRRRASPFPILLQPDFGREQNPKRPVGFHHTPPRPRAGKVKIWGEDIATCHPRSPKGSGTRAGLPPRTPATSLRPLPSPAGAWLPRAPTPGRRPPRQSSGRLQKRDVCRDRSGSGARAGRPQRRTYRELARPPVPPGVWPPGASAAEAAALGPRLPGRVSARGAGVGVSEGAGRGGGATGTSGGGGGGGRGRGAQEGAPRARGAIFFAFSRELLTSRLCN